MTDILRIRRRLSGAPGAPASLANAEIAYNEVDDTLYYGKGTGGSGGSATAVIPLAGSGAFLPIVGGTLIGALYINAPTNDPLRVTVPAGVSATIWTTVTGARSWSFGTISDGRWAFVDQTGGVYRLLVDGSGLFDLRGTLRFNAVNSDPSSIVGGIEMYPGFGGFGVTGGTLNYNWIQAHQFSQGSVPIMRIDGGALSMQAPLILDRNATVNSQAVPLQQLNSAISSATAGAPFLPLAGGTLSGPLTINTSSVLGVTPLYIQSNQNGTAPALNWGGALGFNMAGAELDFFNLYPSAGVSFSWYQITNTTANRLAYLMPSGDLGLMGGVYAQGASSFVGNTTFQNGIYLNDAVAGNPQDTSRGIRLWGAGTSTYGFVVTSSTLNYNTVGASSHHDFYSDARLLFRIQDGGPVYIAGNGIQYYGVSGGGNSIGFSWSYPSITLWVDGINQGALATQAWGVPAINPITATYGMNAFHGDIYESADAYALTGSMTIRGMPYGYYDTGTLLSIVSTTGPLSSSRAGIAGGFENGVSAIAGYGWYDTVNVYIGVRSDQPPLVLHSVTYDATHVYPHPNLTAAQIKKLRSSMYVLTNSIDTTVDPTPATPNGSKKENHYAGLVTGWAGDGSSITVSGWTVPGSGHTAAGQVPPTGTLDPGAPNATAYFGSATNMFSGNFMHQHDPVNVPDARTRIYQGIEFDFQNFSPNNYEMTVAGISMDYASYGHGTIQPTLDSYGITLAGFPTSYICGYTQVGLNISADTVMLSDGFNIYHWWSPPPWAGTPVKALTWESINYVDSNTLRLQCWVSRDNGNAGWLSSSLHLGLVVDASPMGQIVFNAPGNQGGVQLQTASGTAGISMDGGGNVTFGGTVGTIGGAGTAAYMQTLYAQYSTRGGFVGSIQYAGTTPSVIGFWNQDGVLHIGQGAGDIPGTPASEYLKLDLGGNLQISGTMLLGANATTNMHAVPLQQMNTAISTALGNYLPLAGGVMNNGAGISFGTYLASQFDVSHSIMLYDGGAGNRFGFNVSYDGTTAHLNYVGTASNVVHDFSIASSVITTIASPGIYLSNTKGLWWRDASAGVAGMFLQSDNNWIWQGTNASGGARTIAAIFMHSDNSGLIFVPTVQFNAAVYLSGDPTTASMAANKNYVDYNIANPPALVHAYYGINLGNTIAPGNNPDDTSAHITLWNTGYGFSITGGRLNIVAGNVVMRNGIDTCSFSGSSITAYVPVMLASDPTTAMQAATKQYSDITNKLNYIDVTSGAASPGTDVTAYGLLYIYGSPTAPSTITMPVTTTTKIMWTMYNTTAQPTTVQGTGGGTMTLPQGGAVAVWTDGGGIYPLYNMGQTRSPGDNSLFWATTQYVQTELHGAINPSSINVSGPLSITAGASVPAVSNGVMLTWNLSGGAGEANFVNRGVGSNPGFEWRRATGVGASTLLATLDSGGNFAPVGVIYPHNVNVAALPAAGAGAVMMVNDAVNPFTNTNTGPQLVSYMFDSTWRIVGTNKVAQTTPYTTGVRVNGWGTSAGGARGAITGSSTLAQVAAALSQLLTDLQNYGALGT